MDRKTTLDIKDRNNLNFSAPEAIKLWSRVYSVQQGSFFSSALTAGQS
jgi:hypothetical protein